LSALGDGNETATGGMTPSAFAGLNVEVEHLFLLAYLIEEGNEVGTERVRCSWLMVLPAMAVVA